MIFDDWESKVDLIGFTSDAQWMSEELVVSRDTPLTVGIFSGWGGGKSTFLTILQTAVGERGHFVRFNPWEIGAEDDVRAALLTKVLESISEDGATTSEARKKIKSFIQFLRVGSDAISPILRYVPYAEPVREIADKLLKGASDAIDLGDENAPRKTIREQFRNVIKESNKPVIIAVDDLDRVSPRQTLVILEAIRHFLCVPRVAILLALDRANIERMLALELGISGEEETVRQYLQKFIQLEYHIPPLNEAQSQIFVNLLVLSQACSDGRSFANVLNAVSETRLKDPVTFEWRDSNFIGHIEAGLQQTATARLKPFSRLGQLLAGPLQGNPRQLKRFLNTFVMSKLRAGASGLSLDDSVLARVVALSLIAPAGWHERLLTSLDETGKCGFLLELQNLRANEGKDADNYQKKWLDSAAVQHWLALEPPIESLDLAAYLYVIRESHESRVTLPALLSEKARNAVRLLSSSADSDTAEGRRIFEELGDTEKTGVFSHVTAIAKSPGASSKALDSLVAIAGTAQQYAKVLLEAILSDAKLRSVLTPAHIVRLEQLSQTFEPLTSLVEQAYELLAKSDERQARAVLVARKRGGADRGNLK